LFQPLKALLDFVGAFVCCDMNIAWYENNVNIALQTFFQKCLESRMNTDKNFFKKMFDT
jgi:hypothetical protein